MWLNVCKQFTMKKYRSQCLSFNFVTSAYTFDHSAFFPNSGAPGLFIPVLFFAATNAKPSASNRSG
jgi:hypothetical protein